MKRSEEYVVRFSELKKETETFEFSLGDSFFRFYESSYWEGGEIRVLMEVSKRTDGLTLDVHLEGFLNLECDRCLEVFEHPISVDQTMFLKYGDVEKEMDDDVLMVPRDNNHFDVSQIFYEYLVLSVPIKKVHSDLQDGSSGCNPDMLKKLKNHLLKEEVKYTDPRWDELKKVFDKN
ncbi:MAG: DUF177 domain-containing protein [Bacteroidales bacterium]|nr:DUF177 domain-containing protein [Bacteroidales bacterium]